MTTSTKLLLALSYLTVAVLTAEDDHEEQEILTQSQIWGFGFLAGFAISLLGFLTALLIVCCKKIASDACFQITIKTLFSLAVGALLGDVFVHILPDAYSTEGTQSSYVALTILCSIVFFLLLERVFHACGITHKHWHGQDCHDDHQGAIGNHDHPNRITQDDKHSHDHDHHDHAHHDHAPSKSGEKLAATNSIIQSNNIISENKDQNSPKKAEGETEKEERTCLQNLKGKGPAGYLNLIGSLIHNFIDGLALGVAFATGDKDVYVPVLVAIIAHEIPREMGDVAILMTNEFSNKQTILCNGFVNFISLIGVIIGLAITNLSEAAKAYVLVFVAGNFIYIAADIWRNLFKNTTFIRNAFEFFGLALGVGVMFLLILAEGGEHAHEDH